MQIYGITDDGSLVAEIDYNLKFPDYLTTDNCWWDCHSCKFTRKS